ncbi:unnamed protein product [Ostreobium quekettii]|uniref:Uncharacterized protein n=1 Tax=Ostreobium quekettii TaxID=121088 RepID=A0A8S1IK94_9CHLO|nr:unnamed protein product [Ostreobium quekettii]
MKELEDLKAANDKAQPAVPKLGSRVARGLAIFEGAALGAQGSVQGMKDETVDEPSVLKKQLASAQAALQEANERAKCAIDERAALVREKDEVEVALKEVSAKNAKLQEDAHMLLVKMERQYSGDQAPDLSQEIDHIMQNLVESKMELAELKEQCIVLRNDLYKSRESSMRMAAKMTKMETMLYAKENPLSAKSQSWDMGRAGSIAVAQNQAGHLTTQSTELP